MSLENVDLNKIPRERWGVALGMILVDALGRAPEALLHVIEEGEDKFIKACMSTDRYGIKREEYQQIFKKLKREARRLGLGTPAARRH